MYFSQAQQRALFIAVLLFIFSVGGRLLWNNNSSSASYDFSVFHASYLAKLAEIRHKEKLDSLEQVNVAEEVKPLRRAAARFQRINPNIANKETLQNLPGIGPKMAERIIRFRTQNGLFKRADDLLEIKGIGKKSLSKIRSHLTFLSAKNESD